ncbi:MAG TPA: SDR family NAD(P)-dependent oxidoreductase [Roseimicrobium sp.]|nr:SDR family NAD(P)-dependent oxidoreductase [Roseimicrobium sp.]
MSTATDKANRSGKPSDIAICGIGCVFPQADNLEAFWDNIKKGINSITDVPKETHWSPEDYLDTDPKAPDMTYAARGGFISPIDFNPMDYGIAPKDIEATDTTQIFGMIAAKEALKDAGYWEGKHFDRSRTSVVLGVTSTLELAIPLGARLGHPIWKKALKDSGLDEATSKEVVERISDGYVDWQENSFPGLLGNVAAGRIANRFDLGGTNCVVDAACASSLSALHLAEMELTSGKADMVLTGGIDTFNDIFMYMCFSKTPALSPTGDAKPFSKNGDGTILGEGVGVIVLKRYEDAVRDGDKIYAVLKGIGTSSDGKGNAIYAPSAKGQVKALRRAYEISGIRPSTIELVEAHGTGTKVGDATEVKALAEVYSSDGRNGSWCALGSVKSQIGHTKAASGMAALIKAAMALYGKVLPPTIKVTEPLDVAAPGKSPFYVNTVKRPWVKNPSYPRRAAVSSFGFGGSNFHCVLEEAPGSGVSGRNEISNQIIAFSGSDPGSILKKLDTVPESAKWHDVREFAARSRLSFDAKAPYRLFLVCANKPGSLSKALTAARRNLSSKPGSERWSTPEGAIFGRAEATGKLAVLFPGQGSQYVGMMRDLSCQFPEFLNVFDGANQVFNASQSGNTAQRLSDYIYPHPAFDKDAPQREAEQLKQTQIAQPAIGAACLGGFNVMQGFGLKADVMGGHSYGELVALHAAGRIDAETFHVLSNFRGRLMAEASQAREAGGMLVVKASLETVEELITRENCGVVIANHNAPDQIVLAGTLDAIQKTSTLFSDRSIWNRTLPVSAAFHSPLVANAREPFLARLKQSVIGPAGIPVFANSTADVYPDSADELRSLLAGQLAKQVRFVEQIQAMYECGVRTFVEVGPGNVLSGLVRSILGESDATVVALDASKGRNDGMFDLALALCEISASGHDINLSLWDEEFSRSPERNQQQKSKLNIPICGANSRSPKAVRPPSPPRRAVTETAPASVATRPASVMPAQTSTLQNTPKSSIAMTPSSSRGPASPVELDQALRASREGLAALQKLQEQTAELHRKFLEGQDTALKTFLALVEQQRAMLTGTVPVTSISMPSMTISPQPVSKPVTRIPAQPAPQREAAVAATRPVSVPKPAPAPAPVAAASAPAGISSSKIAKVLMEVVAEKTGYPTEMLNLEMGLDSDLGIDSIKRVEIMSALQSRLPEAPEIKPEQLGSLQTLQQVVSFLSQTPAGATRTSVATTSAPVPVVAAVPTSGLNASRVAQVLMEVVAEKTGYPTEMLNLEMGLDSDLGIDSIKRVEIMSALQSRLPEAPEIKPEQLGSLQTLQQVVSFLSDAPSAGVVSAPALSTAPVIVETVTKSVASEQALERLVVKTTESCGDEGLESLKLEQGATVWVVDDETPLARQVQRELESIGCQVVREPLAALRKKSAPDRLSALVLIAQSGNSRPDPTMESFELIQQAGVALRRTGQKSAAVLVTVSRLDGRFGLQGLGGNSNPVSGGLAGMTKTARHEWPEVHCKAVDLDPDFKDTQQAAKAVVREILTPGPVEIGLRAESRCTVELQSIPITGDAKGLPLAKGDLVIISGGARGVTAQVAISLARAAQPTLVLLGRSPEPESEPSWFSSLTDTTAIKRTIHANLGGQAALKDVETQYRRWMSNREVTANLQQMEQAGAKVVYRSADIRDAAAVGAVLDGIRKEFGPIRGLVHGAGVLADRKIEDKTAEQFELVYSTKVDGLNALLKGVKSDDLKILALFSSFTGRYGRTGQVDYAAANEVLNKTAQFEAKKRPDCRVVSVNWGPWNGGMVNASLKTVFEQEGVGLIDTQAGADYLVRELSVGTDGPVEVVVVAPSPGLTGIRRGPSASDASETSVPSGEAAVEMVVSIARVPVLRSHVLNGKAVVPAALMVEWMAHGAMHGHPGMVLSGLNDFAVLKGIILGENESVTLSVTVQSPVESDSGLRIPVQLVSKQGGKVRTHARAQVVLGNNVIKAAAPQITDACKPDGRVREDVYVPEFLFHGGELEAIEQVTENDSRGISATLAAAPKPSGWITEPLRQTWITEPLMLDGCFQLMILWSLEHQGAHSLPTGFKSFRQYVRRFPGQPMTVRMRVTSVEQQIVRARMECLDSRGKLLASMDGYECVLDPSLKAAFSKNQISRLQQA